MGLDRLPKKICVTIVVFPCPLYLLCLWISPQITVLVYVCILVKVGQYHVLSVCFPLVYRTTHRYPHYLCDGRHSSVLVLCYVPIQVSQCGFVWHIFHAVIPRFYQIGWKREVMVASCDALHQLASFIFRQLLPTTFPFALVLLASIRYRSFPCVCHCGSSPLQVS